MLSLIKQAVQKTLGRFGFTIRRISTVPTTALGVQQYILQQECSMIFDVGANAGLVTREYRTLFPTATIHAFEPFGESFDRLVKNTASDHNVFAHQLAVGDRSGSCILNANTSAATNSILQTDPRARMAWGDGIMETHRQVEVQMTTIDRFASENNVSKIDILKMDIQGAELLALRGAKEILSRQAVSLIYLEIILADSYSAQSKLHEYFDYLESLQYSLLDVYSPIKRGVQLLQLDVIFINNKVAEELLRRGKPGNFVCTQF